MVIVFRTANRASAAPRTFARFDHRGLGKEKSIELAHEHGRILPLPRFSENMQASTATVVAFPGETLIIDLQCGISSAQEAAAIKFGLEELPWVDSVHFLEEGISVWLFGNGASVDMVRNTLVAIGIDERDISFRNF